MSNMKSDCCIIDKLKVMGFQTLHFYEKDDVIRGGPPRPPMNMTTNIKKCLRHFNMRIYESEPWLCGCKTLNKLFCWSCLLFSSEKSVWNTNGYEDLNNIYKAAKKHTYSCNHIICEKRLKMFGKTSRIEFSLNTQYRLSIEQHNNEVKRNRTILAHFVRAVCFLGKQGLAFREHKGEESTNRGNYIEYLHEVATYDTSLKEHLEKSTAFCATLPDIQNDLILSVGAVMTHEIKKEISNASFVSLILTETPDVSSKEQLSAVFRYVTGDGNIEERFICLIDISSDRKADALLNHALTIINDFASSDKLIAQTYGAAVMAGEHNGLQSKLREHCKSAIFVHCYAHHLNLVLLQSASFIKEVKLFFITLAGFGTFFSKSTKRIHALDVHVKKRIPSVPQTRWNFQSRLVQTVKEHKVDMENLFESIVKNENSEWEDNAVICAIGLLTKLKDFTFNFLLTVFSNIFQYSDILFQVLQKKLSDISYCNWTLENFKKYLQNYRNEFNGLWEEITMCDSELHTKRIRLDSVPDGDKCNYRRLFFEVIDTVGQCVSQRFCEISKLQFLCLLDHVQFANFKKKFPEEALTSLKVNYGPFFDFIRLKSELCVIYGDPDMKKNSIPELHQYMKAMNLATVFPETFKLTTLIMTIPATSASVERSFSCLRRIKNYLRNAQHEERLSALALMNIEGKLLQNLRCSSSFVDDVIDVFAQKNRRIQLIYKSC